MAYTRKPVPVYPGPENNFGGQVFDAQRQTLGSVESGFVTVDSSVVPLKSPQTVTVGADTIITVPIAATNVTFMTSAFPVDISELPGHTQYATIPVGLAVQIDSARQGFIYLRGNGGSAVVSFVFGLVD